MLIHYAEMREKFPFIEDYDVVLHRIGGSEALLERLLAKFLASYRDDARELGTLRAEEKREEAHRLVHSIKGVSSNLGLAGMYRVSSDLDVALKAGVETAAEIDSFGRELGEVVRFLDSAPPS